MKFSIAANEKTKKNFFFGFIFLIFEGDVYYVFLL